MKNNSERKISLKIYILTVIALSILCTSIFANGRSASVISKTLDVEIQPRDAKVPANTLATFSALVKNGTAPYTFSWECNGSIVGTQQVVEFMPYLKPSAQVLTLTVEVHDSLGNVGYDAITITDPASINIYLDDLPATATYTIKTDGVNCWAVRYDGYKASESTSASTVFSYVITQMASTGGEISVTKGVYDLAQVISVVGTGIPSLGTGTDSKSWSIHGEGMWSTVLRATSAHNIFEFSNALSITLSDLYLDQNGYNGYAIRGLNSGTSDRSLMRSAFERLEIHGVNTGYYGIYVQNAYFINTWKQIYIRTGGGGMLFESTSTGYGNQHFENILISLYNTNTIGVYLRNNGANYGESTFDRLHIEGGDASGTVGVQLYGSNYNKFTYLKIEHADTGVKIETGTNSGMNLFSGGYIRIAVIAFDFSANSRGNKVEDISVHSSTAGALVLNDASSYTNEPDIFEDVIGYSTDFAATPVVRSSSTACLLKGTILDHKAQAGGTATILSGQTSVTITHDMILTPVWVTVSGSTSDTGDLWVTSIGTTTFTVNSPSVGADRTIYWSASV